MTASPSALCPTTGTGETGVADPVVGGRAPPSRGADIAARPRPGLASNPTRKE